MTQPRKRSMLKTETESRSVAVEADALTHSLLLDCFPWQLCHTRDFYRLCWKKINAALKFGDSMHVIMKKHNFICFISIWFMSFSNKSLFSVNILNLVCYGLPLCWNNMVERYAIAYHCVETVIHWATEVVSAVKLRRWWDIGSLVLL